MSSEQQQFAGNDNTNTQMQTAEASGISGQNRMELYQDYGKTVGGQASTNEKSFSEQSMKDGKGSLEFDNIYDKTTSQVGKDLQQGRL